MSALSAMYRNETAIPFSRYWKKVLVVSITLALVGVVSLFARGLNLGLEFEGGVAWQLPANGVTIDEVRDDLRSLGLADARIQLGDEDLRIRAELAEDADQATAVTEELLRLTGADPTELSFSSAGASWGREITEKAVEALIVFFLVIAVYITVRLRWQMAAGALAAVVHDIIITVGMYALFQWEVTPATVIAFLTIMGYSLYDTLVVFDKVRDNEHRYANTDMNPTQVMDLSLNQVFMRSVNTTITSLLPIASTLVVGAWIMGAVTLREFAVALMIGIFFGAFSSPFVAAPVTVWLSGGGEAADDAGREFRLADRVRQRERDRSRAAAPTPVAVAPGTTIPPRPRKQGKRR